MRWYRDAQLPLPAVPPGTAGRAIFWRLPSGQRINQLPTNPYDAGALVSGHTEAKTVIEAGRARQSTRQTKPWERWRIRLLDTHPGSISWEEFWQNPQTWEANRNMPENAAGEPPGGALPCCMACDAVDAADASSLWPRVEPRGGCHDMGAMAVV
jgi:hypothetical protein